MAPRPHNPSTSSDTRAGPASQRRRGQRNTNHSGPTASGFRRPLRPIAPEGGSLRRLRLPGTSPPATACSGGRRWRRPREEPPRVLRWRPTVRPATASPGRARMTRHSPGLRPTAPPVPASPTRRRSPRAGPRRRPPAPQDPPSPGRPGPLISPRDRPKPPPCSTSPYRHPWSRAGPCRHPTASPEPVRQLRWRRPADPNRHQKPPPRPPSRGERRICPSGPCRLPTAGPGPASRPRRCLAPAVRPAMATPLPVPGDRTPTAHGTRAALPAPATRPAGGGRFPSRHSPHRSAPPRIAPSAVWHRSAPTRRAKPRAGPLRHLPARPRISPSNG